MIGPYRARIPLIAAPMFLVSGVDLVVACCRSGIPGLFPALNCRTLEELAHWCDVISNRLEPGDAPFGVNLIVHPSNSRWQCELEIIERFQVPLVVSGLGMPDKIIERIHAYGGKLFHEVATIGHAKKAIAIGVDGLVLVCAGAGGHTGHLSPFAFVPEVRQFFSGIVCVAGAVGTGRALHAAIALGADFGYSGTLFIPSRESMAAEPYQQAVVQAGSDDIVVSSRISGAPASLLKDSYEKSHFARLEGKSPFTLEGKDKAWRDVWSAGQSVGSSRAIRPAADLIDELERDYFAALSRSADLSERLEQLDTSPSSNEFQEPFFEGFRH